MSKLNRRHLLTILGTGLLTTPCAFARSVSEEITQRLAQAQRDGKVEGLHALLVSQGGTLVFEHYGQGDDEAGRSARSSSAQTYRTTCARCPRAWSVLPMASRSRPARSRRQKRNCMRSFRNIPTLPANPSAIV